MINRVKNLRVQRRLGVCAAEKGFTPCKYSLGMPTTYRPYRPDQMFLLSPSPKDWLGEDHLVYFISETVDRMDQADPGIPPLQPERHPKGQRGMGLGVSGGQPEADESPDPMGLEVLEKARKPVQQASASPQLLHPAPTANRCQALEAPLAD